MVRDMVRAQKLLLDRLGIPSLLTVIGGSMGAMQALEWGILYPETVRSIMPIAGTGRTSPMAIALNAVARQAIFNDPMWKKGNYRPEHPPADGLALARAIGHISFLSDASMHLKFGRRFSVRDGLFDFFGQFEVERYLEYNGASFVERFDTNSFLYLAKALDLYDVAWNFDSREEALSHLRCPSLWFAFTSDWLYPPGADGRGGRGPAQTAAAGGIPSHRLELRARLLPRRAGEVHPLCRRFSAADRGRCRREI